MIDRDTQEPFNKIIEEQDIEMLLSSDIDVSSINIAEFLWYLYSTKQQPNIKFLKLLLEKGAYPNTYSSKGLTAFMIVLLFGKYELTQLFVEYGVNISEKSIYSAGETAERNYIQSDFFNVEPSELNEAIENSKEKGTYDFKQEIEISPFMMAFHNYDSNT